MLKFSPLNDEKFFNPLYKRQEISAKEMADFEKNVRIYQANLRKNACQNEDALVANALNPFLQNLGFDTAVKDKQEGTSEVDLTMQKDENVKIIIEAKKQKERGNDEMITPYECNRKALHEAILYYFRHRQKSGEDTIKFVVIMDFYHFYFFRAKEFEIFFYKNPIIQRFYQHYADKNGKFSSASKFYENLKNTLNSKAYENSLCKANLFDKRALQAFHLNLTPILKGDKFTKKHLEPFFKAFRKDFLFGEFNPNPSLFD